MASPGETLRSLWPPFVIRPCIFHRVSNFGKVLMALLTPLLYALQFCILATTNLPRWLSAEVEFSGLGRALTTGTFRVTLYSVENYYY
jgi:hypothetical protein